MRIKIGDCVELDQFDMQNNKLMRKEFCIVQQKLEVKITGFNQRYVVDNVHRTRTESFIKPTDLDSGQLGNESSLAKALMSHNVSIGTGFQNGKYRYEIVSVKKPVNTGDRISSGNQLTPWAEKRAKFEKQKESRFFEAWYKSQLESQENLCAWCKSKLVSDESEVDHVVPLLGAGTNSYDNLVISCHACNEQKSNKSGYKKPSWIEPNKILAWAKNKRDRR